MYKSCVKSCQNHYNESVVQFKYNVIGHTGITAVRINNWSSAHICLSQLPIGDPTTVPYIGVDSMA